MAKFTFCHNYEKYCERDDLPEEIALVPVPKEEIEEWKAIIDSKHPARTILDLVMDRLL